MNPRIKSLLFLHTAVFLWGFTAILGKLVSYNSFNLVWHRMLITALVYLCLPAVWRGLRSISWQSAGIFIGIGVIVCAHWVAFYGSIKLGNSASVTLACLGTTSFFSAILDPLINRKPFLIQELLLGLLVVAGILLIYFALPQSGDSGVDYPAAISTGVLSAFLAALFTSLNKRHIQKTSAVTLSALEMVAGALLLSALLPFIPDIHMVWLPGFNPLVGDWDLLWVLLLAIVCTNFTFYLGAYALQELSAFTANLTVNLEPIYGIILGALIFGENNDLNLAFYLGACLILLAVFVQSVLEYRLRRKTKYEEHSPGFID
ncbi:MAG: DMT family transporter [Bacteroidetes bacterium]|nr:DMT family transporter [Bacteroidota bacterium]